MKNCSIFTGRMLILMPNQWCQNISLQISTEGEGIMQQAKPDTNLVSAAATLA